MREEPSCAPGDNNGTLTAAFGAGGYLGDLPPLLVAADGSASDPVLAPRLSWRTSRAAR